MLIWPEIMIFYIDFFSDYDLKISNIGRQWTFPYLHQGVFLIMTSWEFLDIDNMATKVETLENTARFEPK